MHGLPLRRVRGKKSGERTTADLPETAEMSLKKETKLNQHELKNKKPVAVSVQVEPMVSRFSASFS